MSDCIFCAIGEGKVPAHVVYEDPSHVAFLDLHPIRTGHTLVIPRRHTAYFHELDREGAAGLVEAARQVARLLHGALAPPRVGLLVAGWDVAHVHVHVVPMQEYHDLTSKSMLEGTRASPSQDELREVASRLKAASAGKRTAP